MSSFKKSMSAFYCHICGRQTRSPHIVVGSRCTGPLVIELPKDVERHLSDTVARLRDHIEANIEVIEPEPRPLDIWVARLKTVLRKIGNELVDVSLAAGRWIIYQLKYEPDFLPIFILVVVLIFMILYILIF